MQTWEIQLNLPYLPKLDVYRGKNTRRICLKTNIWIKLDYYSNNHIICIIYATFENIELLPFSSEKMYALYCTKVFHAEQAGITYA